jgi:hypothetical protein
MPYTPTIVIKKSDLDKRNQITGAKISTPTEIRNGHFRES